MKTPLGIRLRRLAWTPLRLEANVRVIAWGRAARNAAAVQARLLERLLAQAAETRFGRDHGLVHARTVKDLRQALPIAGYERFEPYVRRVERGEVEALFPRGTRIHVFAMTSGTTGTPKRIPVTDAVARAYREGWNVWGVHAMNDHFEAFGARILQITSRVDETITPSGVPAGAMSGFTAEAQRGLVRRLYIMPSEASCAGDTATKYYLACRLGLMDRRVLPVTANPSTLLGLAREMDRRKEELLRDLADGTLSANLALAEQYRRRIAGRLHPMPERAREIEARARVSGRLYPKDVWQLPLIGTWKGGTLSLYLREMPTYWGDAPIRDIGLIASEGRFSVPLQTDGSAGVLEVTGTFYEFVPEDEIETQKPAALLAHEVEVGRRYFLVVTTPSGLYRYDIRDLVQVVGRMGEAPIIEFLNKGQHASNLTGEKLTEFQVTSAVNGCVARLGLGVRNYCLAPTWAEVPYYSLLVEETEVAAARAGEFAVAVDLALRALNMEYEAKRQSGRLQGVRVKTVAAGAWQDYDAAEVASRRGRIEQYKHKFLASELDFERRFRVLASYAPPGARITV
jgi:hypothetical protein